MKTTLTGAGEGPALAGPLKWLRTGVDAADAASRWVIVATMAGMTCLVAAQVFQRYVMNSSIDSADELSRLFFVWSVFLAIPHGIRRGVHVGIDLFVRMLPAIGQELLNRISALAGMLLMIVIFLTGLTATSDKWNELMPTLPLTAALYYVPVVIASAHSVLHLALLAAAGPHVWASDTKASRGLR